MSKEMFPRLILAPVKPFPPSEWYRSPPKLLTIGHFDNISGPIFSEACRYLVSIALVHDAVYGVWWAENLQNVSCN